MNIPEIAIIEPNTLTAIGLKSILEEIIPKATIRIFPSFIALTDDTPEMYAHYFVNIQIFLEHNVFFLQRRIKTILLGNNNLSQQITNIRTINTGLPEEQLIKALLQMHQQAHRNGYHPRGQHLTNLYPTDKQLSSREIEVLILIIHGLINKEIADKLHISLTTVISHRKNIIEKLGIKSVSGLTIYAVMNGYVDINDI